MLSQCDSSVCVRLPVIVSKAVTATIIYVRHQASSSGRVTVVPVSASEEPSTSFGGVVAATGNPVAAVSGDVYLVVVFVQFRVAVPRTVSRADPSTAVARSQPPSDRCPADLFQVSVFFVDDDENENIR